MRKKLSLLTFLTMFCSFVFGQSPDWGDFSVYTYQNYMTVLASVEIDGDEQSDPTLEIAPFCGNDRRGPVRKTVKALNGKYLAELSIYGNENDPITFKLYNSKTQTMYDHNVSNDGLKIIINEYIGSLSEPYAIKFNSVAKVGDVKFGRVNDAVNYAQAGDVVTVISDNEITSTVVVNKNITLDLNGKEITAAENVYPVIRIQEEAEVSVTGNGAIKNATDYVFVLGASDGSSAGMLTIENGTFHGATTVASVTKGNLAINGGEFSVEPYQGNYAYLINCVDTNYDNGTATVSIKGGTFHNWNPENNAAEGAGTDFCAEGYFAVETSENVYEVVEGLIGKGTETEPFLIRSLKELKFFRDHVNAGKTKYNAEGVHVALAANIDMATEDWSNNIGDDCNYTFDGIFDGSYNGVQYTLSNLNSTETAQKADGYICTGLFGAIAGNATVKNLTIENVNINTADFTGNNVAAVAGFVYTIANKTITIENVTVKGNISINAPNAYAVGTIAGYSLEASGYINITDCAVEANEGSSIVAASGNGAIIGHAAGIVTIEGTSVNNIDITAKGLVGGLAGFVSSSKSVLDNNTVKNVNLTAKEANWVNSAAIAVGTMNKDGLTVANTTFENVNASQMVGSVYANKPTSVVPAVEARIGNVYYTKFDNALAAAEEGDTITVLNQVVITENKTYDLAGLTVTGATAPNQMFRIQDGANVTVKNANITNNSHYVFVLGAKDKSTAGYLTIENGTYVGETTVASVTKGTLTINGGEFKISEKETYDYAYLINCYDPNYKNGTAKVEIKGGKFYNFNPENNAAEGAGTDFCAEGYTAVYDAEGYWEVVEAVAKIGDVNYTSLVDAIKAAQDGDEIKVLRNSAGAGAMIKNSITIDFGGYTYTFNKAYYTSSPYGFYMLNMSSSKNVTLKNGTLTSTETLEDAQVEVLVYNCVNLTLKDMNIIDATDHIKYALSLNSGEINIIGNTSITSDAIAFDAYDYSKYFELPVVNVNTTGTIDGGIEVSATLNITAANLTDDSYIVLQGNGQLFHNGITTTIKKEISKSSGVPGATTDWNTISTPVVGGSNIEEAEDGRHDLYHYEEATQTWRYQETGELESGKGYLYTNHKDVKFSFTGQLNTSAVNVPLSYTSGIALAGFNLVGNPFTHKISVENMVSEAVLADGFYTITKEGAWQVRQGEETIAPLQSVLVKADKAATLTINPKANKTRKASNASLEIAVYNSEYEDVAYVSFGEGLGLDKIEHRNSNIPMVFIPVNGKEYAIATMSSDVKEIPVAFKAMTMGQYTFAVNTKDCEFSEMYLVDNLTGEITDLLNNEYTFLATSKDDANRFVIKFAEETETTTSTENFAYINNGEIIIDNIEGKGVVKIYDMLGRPMSEYGVSESARISTSAFADGIYIIQMSDDNGVKVQKVVID